MGEDTLIAAARGLAHGHRTGAAKAGGFHPLVDTTVQPKAVAFPTTLMRRVRERLVRLAHKHGVALRQSYARIGKRTLIRDQRYAHAKQFNRAKRALRRYGCCARNWATGPRDA